MHLHNNDRRREHSATGDLESNGGACGRGFGEEHRSKVGILVAAGTVFI